ncbi:MAG: hypothetical protein ACTHO8_10210 [Solirubrobacterales bacterium]
MSGRFARYDREADIAWVPTGESADAVSAEVEWGPIDRDSASDEVAIEIRSASKRLPPDLLAMLPSPRRTSGAVA